MAFCHQQNSESSGLSIAGVPGEAIFLITHTPGCRHPSLCWILSFQDHHPNGIFSVFILSSSVTSLQQLQFWLSLPLWSSLLILVSISLGSSFPVLLLTSLSLFLTILSPWSLYSPLTFVGPSCPPCVCNYYLNVNNFRSSAALPLFSISYPTPVVAPRRLRCCPQRQRERQTALDLSPALNLLMERSWVN